MTMQLWPNGIMLSDRDKDMDGCSCPPWRRILWCWCDPTVFFRDKWLKQSSQESDPIETGCCMCAPWWRLSNADVLGQRMTFEKYRPACPFKCGADGCCEDELRAQDVQNGTPVYIGKSIGRFIMPWTPLCYEHIRSEVVDSTGTSKFQIMGAPLLCRFPEGRGETLKNNWMEYSQPMFATGAYEANGDPIAYQTWKYWLHPCIIWLWPYWCRPSGLGIKEMPDNGTPLDQKLLLTLALKDMYWKA